MGCGNSKNKVHVNSGALPGDTQDVRDARSASRRPKSKTIEVKPAKNPHGTREPLLSRRKKSGKSRQDAWGSQDSLGGKSMTSSTADTRGSSATSKFSTHSGDSGFADHEYQRVITEFSDPNRVKTIEEEFETPRDLDLGVVGQPVQQRLSAKQRARVEEKQILSSLREEGLITRPMAKATFGVSFEVVDENIAAFGAIRPPARLAKLERKRKKNKKNLTQEEIQQKLERAEFRRKQKEQERLERIQQVAGKSDVQNALDSFAQIQQEKDLTEKSKEEKVAENREKKMREMQEKLKAKQAHAEAVRKRRQMTSLSMDADDFELERPTTAFRRITDETPVGPALQEES